MSEFQPITRRHFIAAATALAGLAVRPARAAALAPPERTKITIGTSTLAASFLPLYVALDRTLAQQGLDAQLSVFHGGSEASLALAGDTIDISFGTIGHLTSLINAGQSVIGFYAGSNQADQAWLARPEIKSWSDLRGGAFGVSGAGTVGEQVTNRVLRQHGLTPQQDIQVMPFGSIPGVWQALKANRIAGAMLTPPFTWLAQDAGFTLLGTMKQEVSPQWPKDMFIAKTKFIDENPNLLRRFLRAHVAAIRLMRADRALATGILAERLKITPDLAGRAYDEDLPDYDERGNLPQAAMAPYWEAAIAAGEVTAPWPDAKLLDDRFIRSFAEWAP